MDELRILVWKTERKGAKLLIMTISTVLLLLYSEKALKKELQLNIIYISDLVLIAKN
jgi:hypothetical protein